MVYAGITQPALRYPVGLGSQGTGAKTANTLTAAIAVGNTQPSISDLGVSCPPRASRWLTGKPENRVTSQTLYCYIQHLIDINVT